MIKILAPAVIQADPCYPSPCGPNSNCRVNSQQAVCSCLDNYVGSAPFCRPECVQNDECPKNFACINLKCVDPCSNLCSSQNAICNVVNHNPICQCNPGYEGNPLNACYKKRVEIIPENPCYPNPCGSFSDCRNINNVASCSCIRDYVGSPPNCRPECLVSSQCVGNKACVNERCIDPCVGLCGSNAQCSVLNHIPSCRCDESYTGDPYNNCARKTRK